MGDDPLNRVHFPNDFCVSGSLFQIRISLTVVESNDLGVADLPSRVHRRQCWQSSENRFGQLVAGDFLGL